MNFGWELFCWHGFLRRQAGINKYHRIKVVCRTGHDLLYQDFATDIEHYDPPYNETDMWKNYSVPNVDFARYRHILPMIREYSVNEIPIDRYRMQWWLKEPWQHSQDFVPFGIHNHQNANLGYDILMVVRNTTKCNTGFRNWPHIQAVQFVQEMSRYSIACIGMADSADWIPGTDDLRNLPLDRLATVMANSRVIVGPQSGPIHFASLCLLPQVCWQTKLEHATRTQHHWNPFHVPVTTLPSDDTFWKQRRLWIPDINDIKQATLNQLNQGVRK